MRRQLPAHPSSAGEARRMVRRLLIEQGRDDLVECAQLLVSEVVTNALMHSGTSIDVSIRLADDGVLVEVGDGSQHLPSPRHYAPTASTGRGLALLEQAAASWGVVPGIHGKTVWFQLDSGVDLDTAMPPGGERETAAVLPLQGRGSTVRVELLDVPLLLHAAWQQHAEAVLREYLLAHLDDEGGTDLLAMHAASTDALAVLKEQIPRPDIDAAPDRLMSTAADPDPTSHRVELAVPRASLPNFATLDRVLGEAQEMAARGELLTPRVQPELVAMRRWMCAQVADQPSGAAPVAWPPRTDLEPPALRDLDWDDVVTGAPEPMVAADDTDLVVAASDSALELLGYERGDLVGRRLISIIPRRFRQAHLAGFSMHLLTGRGPLLDQKVVVPVLCRSGDETVVDMTIEARRAADGRSMFLATMSTTAPPLL